ncbi:MAG: DUF2333 family protein [Deltaproteobacteria bacterium]
MRRWLALVAVVLTVFLVAGPLALHFGQKRHDALVIELVPGTADGSPALAGAAFGTTVAAIMSNELSGTTGWRPNDLVFWGPVTMADNNASRQLGILQALRETVRIFKDHLTKVSSDDYDANLVAADNLLRNDPEKWAFPSAEGRYKEAVARFDAYVAGLSAEPPTSKPIHARNVELMRLMQAWSDLLGAVHAELLSDTIAWFAVDDAFYHATGVCHAIAYTIPAVEIEYGREFQQRPILAELMAETRVSLARCGAMKPIIVLNGADTSLLANQRRNLDAYVTEARQKIYSIREEIDK